MHPARLALSGGTAAALALAMIGTAFAQTTPTTPTQPPPTTPATSSQQPTRYVNCNTATPGEATAQSPAAATGTTSQNGTAGQNSGDTETQQNSTSTSANGGTTSPTSNSGVDTSTTGNSATQQTQNCGHQSVKGKTGTRMTTSPMNATTPATAPATTTTTPMGSGPMGQNMDALNNNPNGANWLDKFNRPNVSNSTATTHMHRSMHRVKRSSGGGGGGQ